MSAPANHLHNRLRALAQNLWWTWHPEVISLFTDLDAHLWRQVEPQPHCFLESDYTGAGRGTIGRTGASQPDQLCLPAAE